ncbi:hypothetical protein [Actinomadura madurae]|uniref:hypothetical protein n=1 Tax=Actinomadura madurae TaxID=1993 RepID=UPI0027E23A1D|nr:hypothetical protein [Actinomadura madurae]
MMVSSERRTVPGNPSAAPTQTASRSALRTRDRAPATRTDSRSEGSESRARGPLAAVQHHAAEADAGDHEPVDADLEREHVDAGGLGPDHERRATGPASGTARQLLADEPGRGEVGRQRHDRAAVQAEGLGERRPGRGAAQVHEAQQGSEVVAPDVLL